MPSALPRSNAAVTVSKLVAVCAASAASSSPLSAVGACSAALLASASLVRLPLALEGSSLDPISGVTFGAASLIGDGGLSGDAVCQRAFSPPSAGIKVPLFLSVA